MVLPEHGWLRAFVILLFIAIAGVSFSSAVTLVYNEGDLVKVLPEAEDVDGDDIAFVYSYPLNQSGEWQTGYEDAGTYETTVSAFDGKDYTEDEVTIVINNVNRAPSVDVDDIIAAENDLIDVQPRVSDPDGDDVTVAFSPPLDNNGRWQTTFDDAGMYEASVTARDGQDQAEAAFTITIENKNRGPSIITALPDDDSLRIKETEEISFFAEAKDPDGDVLQYSWFVDDTETGDGEEFTYATGYESAGTVAVAVEVSDGTEKARSSWAVHVQNANRAPSVQHLEDVTVDENETLVLELPKKDADGDAITYAISEPVGNEGQWQTGFDDAGVYTIVAVASDGELSDTKAIIVTVRDVDRAPELQPIDDVNLNENEELRLSLSAADPDGDDLTFSVAGLEGAVAENFELLWKPDFEFIKLPSHFFARFLSRLRIDHFVYKPQKKMAVLLSVCGKEKCSNQSFTVAVQNVNREPLLDTIDSITVREGDDIVIEPHASDPDNDYVRFRFSKPLGFLGKWKTGFDDAGKYSVTVTASDGEARVEKNVSVSVNNVNRVPEFGRAVDQFVRENETLSFDVPVSDADGDNLTLIAEDLPQGAEFSDGRFTWAPDYDTVIPEDGGKKDFFVTFGATDSNGPVDDDKEGNESIESVTLKKTVMVTVEDANRLPVASNFTPNTISIALVGQPVVFKVSAFDPDGDELTYRWKFGFLDSTEGHTAVRRKFSSVGEKKVTVVVGDGKDEVEHTWTVRVGRLRKAVRGT